jgi:hypothetical protein
LGDPLKGNLLLLYKPLHLEAQQVSTRIEVRRHQLPNVGRSLPDKAFDTTQDSKKIQVHPTDPNKTTSIAVNLTDMLGVPRELVEHALNVDPKAKPVKQPLRRFDEPKRKAIASELHRLENAGFIREIKTLSWVSNPVIVPKKNTDVQRVCVDYISLNKHCPKDPFPLPHIDQIIDSTAGCARLSFLDAYSGYNQIKLKKEDEEKTAFITPYGVFCYQVMPFGLKNAGATYQRMMQNCLGSQIGRNI